MLKTLLVTILMLAVALVLMAFRVLFVRGGRFPSGHVHDIPALRGRRDVTCAHRQALGGDAGEASRTRS